MPSRCRICLLLVLFGSGLLLCGHKGSDLLFSQHVVAEQPDAPVVVKSNEKRLAQGNLGTSPQVDLFSSPVKVTIPDELKTIDPGPFMPPALTKVANKDFTNVTLKEFTKWLETEYQLEVILKERQLEEEGVKVDAPLGEMLKQQRLFLMLDRLQRQGIGWYFKDNILYLTSAADVLEQVFTEAYPVGDLFVEGFERTDLFQTLKECVWGRLDGSVVNAAGNVAPVPDPEMYFLGDMLFVCDKHEMHTKIAGLLSGLRKRESRIFVLEPDEHAAFRRSMNQPVSVSWKETPLSAAIEELSKILDLDIRLDRKQFEEDNIDTEIPVHVLPGQKSLRHVLERICSTQYLTWVYDNGVIWITTRIGEELSHKLAVYDVRDLCSNHSESEAFKGALLRHISASLFDNRCCGDDVISFPKPGLMVIRHCERMQNEILLMLERYRLALSAAKAREKTNQNSQEIETRYYRMPHGMAVDLEKLIPLLVMSETWKSDTQPQATGMVFLTRSKPEILDPSSSTTPQPNTPTNQRAPLLVEHGVLIIRQTRVVHREIEYFLQQVETGSRSINVTEQSPISLRQNSQIELRFGSSYFKTP